MTLRTRTLLPFALLTGLAPTDVPASPVVIQPIPGLVQYAKAHAIPLGDFKLAGAGEAARPGDRTTVLFTIEEGGNLRQWLAEIRSAVLTDREAASKPGTGLGILSLFQSSLKTDTGHEYSFPQVPVALEIQTHGPLSGNDPTSTVATFANARVLATRDYLVHGLAPMAEIELRLRASGHKYPDLSFLFRPRFSAEQQASAKARAQAAGFSKDDERVYAEGYFALIQFAHLAFKTPGVAPIIREMLDSPTLFSGAFVNLDWSGLQLENGADWGLSDRRVFCVPYNFRSKTQATGHLYVTAPDPPLQNTAGIVGLTIDSSSKTATKRLIMRVLAGRRSGP